jgi:hypothetical protein
MTIRASSEPYSAAGSSDFYGHTMRSGLPGELLWAASLLLPCLLDLGGRRSRLG